MTANDDLDSTRELRAAVERLPRELRPGRDLWPAIAGRLGELPRRGHAADWRRLAAAMVLFAGGLLLALILRPDAPRPARETAARAAAPAGLAAAESRQRDGVLHAHGDLVRAAALRHRLDRPGAAALAAGLGELDRAMAEIEAALAEYPDDRRLRLALAAAYRREAGWAARLGRI